MATCEVCGREQRSTSSGEFCWVDGGSGVEADAECYRLGYEKATRELAEARRLLALRHGCTALLYTDDGELQCGECGADFRRQTIAEIEATWVARNVAVYHKAHPEAPNGR